MGSVMQGLVAAANQDPRLSRVFSTYTANNPSIYLNIDREKAQALGLAMTTCSTRSNPRWAGSTSTISTCSVGCGRSISRAKRPTAPIPRRSGRSTSATNRQRRADARDRQCPHRSRSASHHPVQQLPGDPDTGQPVAWHVVRRRLWPPWKRSRPSASRRATRYEWTGTAYQEVAASGQTGVILALAMLFAFLFLVGLYESWMIPMPVLLSVPVGVLGAFVGVLIAECRSTCTPRSDWSC